MTNTSCNSCDYCNYCNYCDYCNYCNYCNYCKNLKMTEYNYFCRSKIYNDEESFQQKRYRIFNVEVGKEAYYKVPKICNKLKFDKDESSSTSFQTAFKKMWATLTKEQKQEYYDIPHFNREGFTFITGVAKEEEERELTPREIFKKKGRTKQAFEEMIGGK